MSLSQQYGVRNGFFYINLDSAGMLNDISVGAAAGFGVHTFLPFLSAKNFKN